ncbi:MAG: hypothetical protein ACLVLH_13435 [Eisenbergiella massiliensis]
MVSFCCITAACAAVMVNIIFTPTLRWSAYVIGGSLYVARACTRIFKGIIC